METPNRTLKQTVYREIKEFLVITIYLWIVFALLVVYKSMILGENYFDVASHGFALINALALAKVMLVARDLKFADKLKDASLIYPTLLKSAAFSLLLAFFKILEDAALGVYRGRSFNQSIADFGGGTWKGILILTAIMFVVLIPFFAFTGLQRVLAEGQLEELFFHRHRKAS